MNKILFSIYDKKSEKHDGFMVLEEDIQAVRGFSQACEQNQVFKKWPEDFALYKLGEIDTKKGLIKSYEKPIKLVEATYFVKKENGKTPTDNK